MRTLARLWRGEIGLARTYWLWGALVGGGIGAILAFSASIGLLNGNRFLLAVDQAFSIIWTPFIAVAIWRSAGNYKGRTTWKVLARINAVFAVLFVAVNQIALFLGIGVNG